MRTHAGFWLRALLLGLLGAIAVIVPSGADAKLSATATAIAAGGDHTCVLTGAGGAKCWGINWAGQLGDGTTTDRHTPVSVSGLGGSVASISAGVHHSCALTAAGGVKCWGANGAGQLGDGTTTGRSTPVPVFGLDRGVAAISAGAGHTCALTSRGGVKCWGDNRFGQLGDGTTTQRLTAVEVSGLSSGVAAISAGVYHTCAVTNAGAAKCWGLNHSGWLGDGTTTQRLTPVGVSGLSKGVAAISAATYHTCALRTSGAVKCWGENAYGQLGDGTEHDRHAPVTVSGLARGAMAIAAGRLLYNATPGGDSCALMNAGKAKCWGFNYSGQLGDGTTITSLEPVGVIGFGGSVKCAVPYVRGMLLSRARSTFAQAHCRVGTVTRVASRRPKNAVVSESPRPYTRLTKGARVNLKVSRGR